MSNPAKRKGTAHEVAIVDFLKAQGIRAYRPAQTGYLDTGDIHGISPFVGQAKAWADTTAALREGVDGAVAQAQRAGERYGVAFIKRTRRSVGDTYVVMRLEDWARLLLELHNRSNP